MRRKQPNSFLRAMSSGRQQMSPSMEKDAVGDDEGPVGGGVLLELVSCGLGGPLCRKRWTWTPDIRQASCRLRWQSSSMMTRSDGPKRP